MYSKIRSNIKTKNSSQLEKRTIFLIYREIAKYKLVPIVDEFKNVIDYANEKRFKQIPQSEPVLKEKSLNI